MLVKISSSVFDPPPSNFVFKMSLPWEQLPSLPASPPPPHSQVLQTIIPLVMAGLLWRAHHAVAAAVVLVIAVVLAVISRVQTVGDFIRRGGALLGEFVGRALTIATMALLYWLLFVPRSIVLRARGRDPLASQPDQGRVTYWDPVQRLPGRPLFNRQFAYDRPELATSGGFSSSVIRLVMVASTLAVLNAALGLWLTRTGFLVPQESPFVETSAAWMSQPTSWRDVYMRDFLSSWGPDHRRFHPFVGARRTDFSSEHINVKGGIRRSYSPANPQHRPMPSVFFFGGSAMWGTGARDLHTIPSEVARLAEHDGLLLQVSNFGESAWSSWQGALLLSTMVVTSKPPDLAVFYDGFNDVWLQHSADTDRPSSLEFEQSRRILAAPNDLRRTFRYYNGWRLLWRGMFSRRIGLPGDSRPINAQAAARNAAKVHAQAIELARRISATYKFEVLSFWQPTLFTKRRVPGEEALLASFRNRAVNEAVYRSATAQRAPTTIDLSRSLDGLETPVFLDQCHVTEAANLAIATEIYRRIAPILRARQAETREGGQR